MKNLKKYDFCYDKAVQNWDEAIALGNARLGSLVYGDGPLKISVDRVDLWDNRPDPTIYEKGFTWENLVKLSRSGKEEDWNGERYRLFEFTSRRYPYPTKLTAGRLELDFGVKTENVKSHLSLQTALGTVLVEDGKAGKVELFLSATKFIGVARVWGDYRMNLHIPYYLSHTKANESGIDTVKDGSLRYPPAKIREEGEYAFYEQDTHTDYSFGIVALTKNCGEYKEIYYTVATTEDAKDYIAFGKKQLADCAKIGYDALQQEHIAWWNEYWKKSEISVGDKLFEETYYRSYYLFGSCSRKGIQPMPLQAVWTADNDSIPPWNGDYHHDLNTQMFYQSYLKGNRMEEGVAFADYMWELRDTYKAFAKSFYKAKKGLIIPSTMSLDGKPLAGWAHYTLSPTNSIWVAQSFDEYWLYSGDKRYLRTRAYPFFKDIADAITPLLEEKEGKLYLPLSSSPEIFDNERRAYLEPNSNFDLALLIYLYKTLAGYAEILGKDSSKYLEILSKLDDIAVNEEGVIMLDKTQMLPFSHRHFSHLMCLYPLHLLNYDTEEHKRIYRQTIWNMEQLGEGWWIGFSFAWSAQLYAMMYNGNAAYEKLRTFARGYVSQNGFHLSGDFKWYGFSQWHYRPFTLESIFGFCDALQEMLLQEHQGYIHVFPAIPDDWKEKVSFKRLRSYQGVLVSAQLKDGKTQKVVLESRRNVSVQLFNSFDGDVLIVKHGKTEEEIIIKQGEKLSLNLRRGKTIVSLKK